MALVPQIGSNPDRVRSFDPAQVIDKLPGVYRACVGEIVNCGGIHWSRCQRNLVQVRGLLESEREMILTEHEFVRDVRHGVPAPVGRKAARLAYGVDQAARSGKNFQAAVGVIAVGILAAPASSKEECVLRVEDKVGLEGLIVLALVLRRGEGVTGCVE